MTQKIFNISANAKTVKGDEKGYLTGIIYLAPHTLAGVKDSQGFLINLCKNATKPCIKACLNTSGRGVFKTTQQARIKKTRWLFEGQEEFMMNLVKEIKSLIKRAKKNGMIPTVRLNGTSDLDWKEFKINGNTIFELFPDIQFYDYTKRLELFNNKPSNLHLTFSFSGDNKAACEMLLNKGHNVAAVVSSDDIKNYLLEDSHHFVDGDLDDLRFLDGQGKIVLLKAKGRAKKDNDGFLVA